MDIFNKKRIAELEKKLRDTEVERDAYIYKASELEMKLEEVSKLEETIPEGCEKGPWCKACEFLRAFRYTSGLSSSGYPRNTKIIYTCAKGESCKNFVQKENKDEQT